MAIGFNSVGRVRLREMKYLLRMPETDETNV
jgi:hypothetical protein